MGEFPEPVGWNALQIAFVSVYSLLGIVFCLPALLGLFAAAYFLASSRKQLFVNLIAGHLFAVIAILSVALLFDPKPNSWADLYFGWIIVGVAPIAAGLGVVTAVGFRFLCVRRLKPFSQTGNHE